MSAPRSRKVGPAISPRTVRVAVALVAAALVNGCDKPGVATDEPGKNVGVFVARSLNEVSAIANAKHDEGYRIADLEALPDGTFVLVVER